MNDNVIVMPNGQKAIPEDPYAEGLEIIARICHQTNKAYCEAGGDTSQVDWAECSDVQKKSSANGVLFLIQNPGAGPDAAHQSWFDYYTGEGWTHGPVKNPELKTHPCLVPYDDLPVWDKAKDAIFHAIVRAMTEVM